MKKYTLNEEGAVVGGMDAPVPVKLPYVAEPVRSSGGVINNITYNIDNSQRTWNGGSFVKDGLGWFKTNWKAIAIAAGTAALVAGLIALISKLTKSIKLRYNKCVRTLARAQHDFTLEEKGLDMKAIMPGVGSALADKLSYLFTRIGRGKSSRSTNSNNNIGLYPFCNKFISETNDDYTTAVSAFNKIKLASDESSEGGSSSESFNGKVYGSFREAIMSDYITESADGKQHVDESVLAMVSAGISLAAMAVKAGRFILSRKDKNGKTEEKAVQVTKESTREICYAIMLNYLDKYINVEQVFKQIGINTASLSDIDKSSCDKLAMMLKRYSKPEPNVVTKQYNRVKAAYDGMLKHYYNIGYGIIGNFKKYTEAKDEKHENLLVSANEKLTNMWDSQKDTYDNNFSHVIIEITSSEPYQNYLNFIVEKVIPVFKSGIAGDADYVLDTYPRRGEMYVVRQSLAQDNLPGGKPVELKGKAALVSINAFDLQKREITFTILGGIENGSYSVDDHGIAKVEMDKLDTDAYKTDNESQRMHKLPYAKWLALDPCLTTESSIRINEIGTGETDIDGKNNNFYIFTSNAASVLNANVNISLTQITNIVIVIGDKMSPNNIYNIRLDDPKSTDDIKKLIADNADRLKLTTDNQQKALPFPKNDIAGFLPEGKSVSLESSFDELPNNMEKIIGGNVDKKQSSSFSTIYSRDNDNGKEYLFAIGAIKKNTKDNQKGNENQNPADKAMSTVENPKNRQEKEQNDNLESGNGGNSAVGDSVKYEFSNELNESLKALNSLYSNALFEDGEESNNLMDDTKEKSNDGQITADGENGNEKIFSTIVYVVENKEGKRSGYKLSADAEFSAAELAEKVKSFKNPFGEADNQEKLLKDFLADYSKWNNGGATKLDSLEEDIDKINKDNKGDEDEIDASLDGGEESKETTKITSIYYKEYDGGDGKKIPMFAVGFFKMDSESVNDSDRQHLNDDINESAKEFFGKLFKGDFKGAAQEVKNDASELKSKLINAYKNGSEKVKSNVESIKDKFKTWGELFKKSGIKNYDSSEDKNPIDVSDDENKEKSNSYDVISPDDEKSKESKVHDVIVAKKLSDDNYVGIKFTFVSNSEPTVADIDKELTKNGFGVSNYTPDKITENVDLVKASVKDESEINIGELEEAIKKFESGEEKENDSENKPLLTYIYSKGINDKKIYIVGVSDTYTLESIAYRWKNVLNEDYSLESSKYKFFNGDNMGTEKVGYAFVFVADAKDSKKSKCVKVIFEASITAKDFIDKIKSEGFGLNEVDSESFEKYVEQMKSSISEVKQTPIDNISKTIEDIVLGGQADEEEIKKVISDDVRILCDIIELHPQDSSQNGQTDASTEQPTSNDTSVNSSYYQYFKDELNENLSPDMLALKTAFKLSSLYEYEEKGDRYGNNKSQQNAQQDAQQNQQNAQQDAQQNQQGNTNDGGWHTKSKQSNVNNNGVSVSAGQNGLGPVVVTFQNILISGDGGKTQTNFSFGLDYDKSTKKTSLRSTIKNTEKVKSNFYDVNDTNKEQSFVSMCDEVIEGLKKMAGDNFHIAIKGKVSSSFYIPFTNKMYEKYCDNYIPKARNNEPVSISYCVDDFINESDSTNINVSRYINKQGKGWYVLSESYYDDGYGYTSKLENSSYRNRLKTRDDFTTFAKSFVNAKFAKLEPEMNFTVVSNQSYKPSIITPLCECIVVVKFDKNDNVMYKHYLGKRVISK